MLSPYLTLSVMFVCCQLLKFVSETSNEVRLAPGLGILLVVHACRQLKVQNKRRPMPNSWFRIVLFWVINCTASCKKLCCVHMLFTCTDNLIMINDVLSVITSLLQLSPGVGCVSFCVCLWGGSVNHS